MSEKSRCLTEEELRLAARGEIPAGRLREVEDHLERCDLCRDAVEGMRLFLSSTDPRQADRSLHQLKEQIRLRTGKEASAGKPEGRVIPLRSLAAIAASLLILIAAGYGIRLAVRIHDSQVAVSGKSGRKEKRDYTKTQYLPPPADESSSGPGAEKPVYTLVEELPAFPGGETALDDFLSENISCAAGQPEGGAPGSLFVNFVVEEDGSITHVRLVSETGAGCSDEALQGIESMPAWIPGKVGGKNVRVSYTLLLKFS